VTTLIRYPFAVQAIETLHREAKALLWDQRPDGGRWALFELLTVAQTAAACESVNCERQRLDAAEAAGYALREELWELAAESGPYADDRGRALMAVEQALDDLTA